jgi:transposase
VLRTKAKPAIVSKRRRKLQKDVILLHDNAPPHTANQTVETVNELRFELTEHPPYTPDLDPSDFQIFGPMKEALRRRTRTRTRTRRTRTRFSFDEEVIGAVQNWLKTQPKTFF